MSKQNFMRLSTAGNSFSRFSMSYRLTSRRFWVMWPKYALVLSSVAMPVGTTKPARPLSAWICRMVSANKG
ncbi:hypothetical protein D9M71_734070 [compost metagenome]